MQIKLIKSQFGVDRDKTYSATDYGEFYLILAGGVTFEIEKKNAEVVE